MRLLVVGWPGAQLALLESLLRDGRLPHLARIVAAGRIGGLAVPPPACHAAAWTTAATGCLADRHGVLADAELRPDGGGVQPAGHRSWRVPAFWEVLEREGHRTACIGWPATAPASRWAGSHVDERFAQATGSDFDSWAQPPGCVTPPELRGTLRELRIHPADGLRSQVAALLPEAASIDPRHDQRPLLLEAALAQVGTVHAAATQVAEGACDVLCVAYHLLERIVAGRQEGDNPQEGPYVRLLQRAYAFHDMMLGRLVQLAGTDATVMVLSAGGVGGRDAAGFLVAGGAGISPGALPGAALTDVAPSILGRFGLTSDCDGEALAALVPGGAAPRRVPPRVALAAEAPTRVLGEAPTDVIDAAQAAALRHLAAAQALNLAEVQVARGLAADAAATLEQLRQSQPEHTVVLARLAECRALLGDVDACLKLARALLEASPTDPWGHVVLAASHVLKRDPAGAAPHLAQARALAPADPQVALRLGGLHLLQGDPAAAEACFRAALTAAPGMAEALFGLGAALAAQGRPVGAEEALRASLARQHRRPQAHLQLGVVLMAQGRWPEAITALDTARAQQPDLPEAGALLAEARAGHAQRIAATAVGGRG